MSFVEDFLSAEVTFVKVDSLRKDELFALADHFKLPVTRQDKKAKLKFHVIQALVEQKVLPDSDIELVQEDKNENEMSELQFKLEMRKIDMQMQEKSMQNEKEIKMQMQERQMQGEREEREYKKEMRLRELEIESQREKRLERESNSRITEKEKSKHEISRNIKLVPKFHEKDVEKYFQHFEKIAQSMEWAREIWSMMLQSVLIGKAQEVYAALSLDQSADYEIVKDRILQAYELVPEAYRQKFRYSQRQHGQTHVELAREKENTFDRWLMAKKVDDNFRKLKQLMLLEEFKRCVSKEVKTHLDEQKVDELKDAAILADDYELTHKHSFQRYQGGPRGNPAKGSTGSGHGSAGSMPASVSGAYKHVFKPQQKGDSPANQRAGTESRNPSGPTCFFL